jgi:hypothetical protein
MIAVKKKLFEEEDTMSCSMKFEIWKMPAYIHKAIDCYEEAMIHARLNKLNILQCFGWFP